ncbi:MAG TPA: hypothetical protein VG099_10790 [Gemmataceae bacterium]|nr:hypothetical protein [Gemmataceae bacterium]
MEKFYASTVLAAISNTDYEGEIKNKGDRVKIRTKPTITIHNYSSDGLLGLDRPTGGTLELYIGNGKYFSLILDDVMEIQSDLNILSMWSDDAAQQLKITVDQDVLDGIVGQMAAANQGVAAGVITGSINLGVKGTPLAVVGRNPGAGQVELLDVLMRMGQVLDEQNIPEVGRWVVMPSWAGRQIKQSELRQAYLSGDSVSMLRNGRLGMVDRFTIYISNLLPNNSTDSTNFASGEWPIFAGHAHGLTFASQISKVETLRSELTFGQILRGLQVYGYQVVDGKALVQAQVTPAS